MNIFDSTTYLYLILFALILAEFVLVFFTLPVIRSRGAPYIPSERDAIKNILELSKIKSGDKAADLGSGDGRLIIAFAKKGIEAHGYEVSPILVMWARFRISILGLSNKAFVHRKSF